MPVDLPLVFAILISVQFVVVVFHDMVDIPGWTHGSQVRAALGLRKFWIATIVNAVFPAIAFVFAVRYWHGPRPQYVTTYWLWYCAVTVFFAATMWWVPYFFGTKSEAKRLCAAMYAGTKHVLPPRGDNPRPNLLHVCFHTLFVLNLALAAAIRYGQSA